MWNFHDKHILNTFIVFHRHAYMWQKKKFPLHIKLSDIVGSSKLKILVGYESELSISFLNLWFQLKKIWKNFSFTKIGFYDKNLNKSTIFSWNKNDYRRCLIWVTSEVIKRVNLKLISDTWNRKKNAKSLYVS